MDGRTWRLEHVNGVVALREGEFWIDLFPKDGDAGAPEWSFKITTCVEELARREHAALVEEVERLHEALSGAMGRESEVRATLESHVIYRDNQRLLARVADLEQNLERAKGWIRRLVDERSRCAELAPSP